MLVTFSCEHYENITMFGDVAKRLLTMMGHSATIPGAILADDIPQALSRLQTGIEQEKQPAPQSQNDDDEETEPQISLAHRAVPLIAMLKAAQDHKSNLMWK